MLRQIRCHPERSEGS